MSRAKSVPKFQIFSVVALLVVRTKITNQIEIVKTILAIVFLLFEN